MNASTKSLSVVSLASVLGLILLNAVLAQTTSASLQGTVTDLSGAVIPQASVQVRNVGTGAAIETTTDQEGRYRAPVLQPGDYELKVAASGFQTILRKNITLAVGQGVVVDLQLQPGQISNEVTVEAGISTINTVNASLSGLVEPKQIRELPLNGRSFEQLAMLQPGVAGALSAGNDVVGGRTPKISVNGARPEQNNFLLDGTDINNVYGKTPGSVAGVLLGVEAVREFQVLTNAYSAEFGSAAGGVINAVTRTGTNDYHGSIFYFHRNSAFDARNFFNPRSEPDPFKRNQYGGVLGGPIKKEKTFFFVAYESLIERLGVVGNTAVPDDDARRGQLRQMNGTFRPVVVNPAIPRYLDALFPHGNGPLLTGGGQSYFFSRSQPTDEYYVQGRIDHQLSAKAQLFGRYTISDGKVNRWPTNTLPLSSIDERSRNQYLTTEYQRTFSPSFLNTTRLGFSRSVQKAINVRTSAITPDLAFIPGEPFGFLSINGLVANIGGEFRLPRLDYYNNFQLANTTILTKGSHNLKFGWQGQRIHFNQYSFSQQGGVVIFSNLENFLRGIPFSADVALSSQTPYDPVRGWRQWYTGLFVQDDYKFRPGLTFNIGLRYEYLTPPSEVNGKVTNLRELTDPTLTVGEPFYKSSKTNFAPRIGVAWDPFGTGKTSVRAGFGIFYDQLLPKYLVFSGGLNPPFSTRISRDGRLTPIPFPNILQGLSTIEPILQTAQFNLTTPYLMQYNLSVQRQLPGETDLTIAYAGSRGNHLIRLADANLAPETIVNGVKTYQPTLGRRYPNFSGVTHRETDAQSYYNALQIGVIRRFARGFRAQLSYTYSRSIDDASGINAQDFNGVVQYGLDYYDRTVDRGLSAFHVAHNLAFNWTYELPWARNATGLKGALFKGWVINNISTIRSGSPFTVRMGFNRSGNLNTVSFSANERPNLKPGYSSNPITGDVNRWFDVNAFELPAPNTRGTLGRNTLFGPGQVNLDLSFSKTFRLGEKRQFQFRTEVFNFPNHTNFSIPSGLTVFTNDTGALAPTAGRITSTTTTARQIQLAAKITF
ncbi:MAG TPA: TonB-dependent receptor [Blastocatellia bacterium]|nr:TonB-dependent receptor [Blastocatellia bacterium]